MDSESLNLLKSVARGSIRDAERIREILRDAAAQIEGQRSSVRKSEEWLYKAQQAFLDGWPTVKSA